MFRPTKKRTKKVVRTTATQSDDEEEPPTVVVKKPSKKKSKRPVAMSFQMEDGEDPMDSSSLRKSKKRKRGMGFGGAAPSSFGDDQEQQQDDEQEGAIRGDEPMTFYGKDALNKLKSQQKYKLREETVADGVNEGAEAPSTSIPPPNIDKHATKSNDTALPSYIPLSGKDEHVILAGDEAIDYETKQQLAPLQTTTEDAVLDAEQAEESAAWEAQVASRAGIRPNNTNSGLPTRLPERATPSTTTSSASSLTKLRDQVKSALSQLELQTQDVQNAHARRKVEVTQVEQELSRQETELEQAGTALEYYQGLREQMASWVGALRELKTKVTPLQEALHKVERLGGNRWKDWQDDSISILREAGLLDQVLGRQPVQENVQVTTVVDEFGRDVKSQVVLQRDKRVRQRRMIREERKSNDDDSDALLGNDEQEEMKTRRDALREALAVALDDVDEEYTKLSNLISIFAKWAETYPEEYRQCYASMSLADLASVLIQADLCSTHHPLRWQNDDSEELPWIKDLDSIPVGDATEEEDTPSYRMADKVLIPIFLELLDEGAYDLLSSKESRSLSSFYSRIRGMFANDNALTRLLESRIVQYLKSGLDDIAIPILKRDAFDESATSAVEIQDAVNYAKQGQVRRIEKVVCNLLKYWKIDAMAQPLLVFITSKYLFLLSSLHQDEGCKALVSESFGRVMTAIRETGWLDRSEFMLQAAPIRAAAGIYVES